jgi:diketogulonate reductase-like aldo/keto reductase
MTIPSHTLNDGFAMPAIGLGTWPLRGDDGHAAIVSALGNGYRLVDSAVNYHNEDVTGRAVSDFLASSGVPRDEITVQTKLPGRHHDYDLAVRSGHESLERLGLDRIDVMLIHWPNPLTNKFRDAWRGLVELRRQGVVRSIGVSNFTPAHLEAIIEDSGVTPAVNQIEYHPYLAQDETLGAHARLGVLTQSWTPLGRAAASGGDAAIADAAAAHSVTPAQVVLRWHIQQGAVPLPKSANPERQRANLDVFGFALSDAEMAAISGLARPDGRVFGAHPDSHEEM